MRVVRITMLMLALALPGVAGAQDTRPSLMDSFRLGNTRGALCQMQSVSNDPAAPGMFDRAWSIVCRDAARPVGQIYALRGEADPLPRIASGRDEDVTCQSTTTSVAVADLGEVDVTQCRFTQVNVGYRIYKTRIGKVTYVAQGLAGYDSALELGLRTVVTDRKVEGEIRIATIGLADPVSFARVQAGSLDPAQTLAEGYRRNNAGNYAEAAEFFGTLQNRLGKDGSETETPEQRELRRHEYIVNQALQKSNLGEFAEADALFVAADAVPTRDLVQTRLRRNFEALHLLNQQRIADASAALARPVPPLPPVEQADGVEIDARLSASINSTAPDARAIGAAESASLSPQERAAILDAQALQLSGTAMRLQDKPAEARRLLDRALAQAGAVRGGRVTSITRLRAQIMAEAALAEEDRGNNGAAEDLLRRALSLLRSSYPDTTAMNGGRARLAAFLIRRGKKEEALALYREVVSSSNANRVTATGLGNMLAPYFELLSGEIAARPELISDMFLASQTLVRPGVADTQAILARELQEGGGEPARLFRQAVTLSRDIERTRIELARLGAADDKTAEITSMIATRDDEMRAMVEQQSLTFARLSEFPQFRALSTMPITLDELRAGLKPGEAYYKLAIAGPAVFAIYADGTGATGWKVPLSANQLADKVRALRSTISIVENGQSMTYPFDVTLARSLYVDLFSPVTERMAAAKHLIFEPDGAMLQLPINLLIADQAGIDSYLARLEQPNADEFDFRGIEWLGRRQAVSTAVSARAFRDTRRTPASTAARQYLGLGNNAPATDGPIRTAYTRSIDGSNAVDCRWPLDEWNKPIAATELRQAASLVGSAQAQVLTGSEFTDTAVRQRSDLADYRILHFATHGLVTAPRPECPARPALLTSFGGEDSDGLLSFREIYDLKIDADLVILSACDTAGSASRAATREAGITTGGGSALDGLVRAFIGAGGRSVIASHWPAPDDFKATENLISGLFSQGSGTPVAFALQAAERTLMDEAATSHPYYWSGFAIVGDGAQPLILSR